MARHRLFGLLFALFGTVAPQIGLANTIPLDEPGFTKALAEAFQAAMPDQRISLSSRLTLTAQPVTGSPGKLLLDTIYDYCQRNPEDCEAAVASHVAKLAASFAQAAIPPTAGQLRAILRTGAYADAIRKGFAGKEAPPIEPFVGDLWILCAFDMPDAIMILRPGDLAMLGMSRDEAMARAIANDTGILQPIAETGQMMWDQKIGFVSTGAYDSSRLLLPDEWASLASQNDGHLLVAAPGNDIVIYADERLPNALQLMRDRAELVAKRDRRPLSTLIFRWTPKGWVLAGE